MRLFSSWAELIDPAARRLLDTTDWTAPDDDAYPTGQDWTDNYVQPLAAALGDIVQLGTKVIGVARRGRDRVVDAGRDTEPLSVHIRRADGTEDRVLAQAVIDASGTWGTPNPLGGEGLPALGERAATEVIEYRVPDVDDPEVRDRYAGKRIVIAGSGHSALTAIVALADLEPQAPGTRISWVLRRGDVGSTFGGGDDDELPARGALGLRAKRAVDEGLLTVVPGFRTATIEPDGGSGRVALISDTGARIEDVDQWWC